MSAATAKVLHEIAGYMQAAGGVLAFGYIATAGYKPLAGLPQSANRTVLHLRTDAAAGVQLRIAVLSLLLDRHCASIRQRDRGGGALPQGASRNELGNAQTPEMRQPAIGFHLQGNMSST